MIKRKTYKCKHEGCETEQPILSKGLCNFHRNNQRKEDGTLPTYSNKIKPISDKRKKQKKEERGCLGAFFEFHIQTLEKKPFSEESGRRITEPSAVNICHLLPKRKQGGFPSVQCHTDNAVYLTLDEHTRFDKLLDERKFTDLEKEYPNIWGKVCNKLKKLLSLCTERNKMYVVLTEYLEE